MQMQLKKRIVLTLTMTAIVVAAAFTVWSWIKKPDPSAPVAWVDGTKIPLKELQREMKKTRDRYAMQNVFPKKAELKQLKKEVLERLIERELLWQEAGRQDVNISDTAVRAELEAIKKQFGNEAILDNMLRNWKMSRQDFLGLIKRDLTIEALIKQNIGSKISISDSTCKNYYHKNLKNFQVPEQIRASHICIFAYENDPETKKQKAQATIQSIEKRLKQGETFENLAREASECVSSERGGDLGLIVRGSMDPKFEKAAFDLKLHEVSSIVRSSIGYHIIKVTAQKPARVMPFKEVKENIAEQLKDEKINSRLKEYLSGLQKRADIKRLL